MFWMVGQHALHDTSVDFLDQRVESMSIFPFFDAKGNTRALMLTETESGEILLVPYRPNLFKRLLLRPKQIRLKRADLRNRGFDQAQRLAKLWHFDPWWELADERYSHHSAAPLLRSTNLLGFGRPFDRLWFDSSLSRARLVAVGSGEETKLKRFSPKLIENVRSQRRVLPEPRRASKSLRQEWKLRPFWQGGQGFRRR